MSEYKQLLFLVCEGEDVIFQYGILAILDLPGFSDNRSELRRISIIGAKVEMKFRQKTTKRLAQDKISAVYRDKLPKTKLFKENLTRIKDTHSNFSELTNAE